MRSSSSKLAIAAVIAMAAVDPLAALQARGALVGYEALVEATKERPISIWYGGVEQDSLIEIAGPSGEGKTTLAVCLAVALANPTDAPVSFLGRPVTPIGTGRFVVVVEEENGRWSLRQKLETACQALSLPVEATIDRVINIVRQGVLVNEETWTLIEALGQTNRVGALVVDSRARVLQGGESNREEDQAKIANTLHRMVQACHAPVIVISHTRKGEKGAAPSSIEDVSGSGQRGAGADVLLLVTANKSKAGKVLASTVKFAAIAGTVVHAPRGPNELIVVRDAEDRLVAISEDDGQAKYVILGRVDMGLSK